MLDLIIINTKVSLYHILLMIDLFYNFRDIDNYYYGF